MLFLRRTVLLWQIALVAVVTFVASELVCQYRFAVGSPVRGLVVLPFAWGVGVSARRGLRISVGRVETCLFGTLLLAGVYMAAARAGLTRWFLPVSVALAILGFLLEGRSRIEGFLRRPIPIIDIALGVVLLGMCARCSHFTDRLPLDRAYPTDFAWIDTPFWLSLGYALERGFPPPDPLFAGERLGYHFGSGLPVAMMRGLTGLPMHTAFFATTVLALAAFPALLVRLVRSLWPAPRSRRLLGWPLAFACIAAAQHFVWAFPTTCGLSLLAFSISRTMGVRVWRDAVLLVIAMCALILTKEVHYFFAVCLGGGVVLFALAVRRRWLPGVALAIALAVSRPLHALAVSSHRKVGLSLVEEHLSIEWLRGELVREHGFPHSPPGAAVLWMALGAAALASCFDQRSFQRANDRRASLWALGIATATYVAGFLLSVVLTPVFDPPLDSFSYAWLLTDMTQFETAGRLILAVTLLVYGLARFGRLPGTSPQSQTSLSPSSLGMTAIFFLYPWIHYWKVEPGPPPDPVVEVLAKIDPATSLIATDHLNWNHENPHWSAFFGHQFLQLRRGRWATASPHYADTLRAQEIILTSASRFDALAAVRRTGTTHVLVARTHPVPWLQEFPSAVENAVYIAYDVRAISGGTP